MAWGLIALTFTGGVMLAADSSADKARQALGVLQSGAPPQEKALACKRLAIYGGAEAVPALAPLLTDVQLASWARIALEVIPGPAADEALRNAMGQVHGRLLVGVINSIGVRRDRRALPGLASRLDDTDADVASAAAVALGRIGGDQAAQALTRALPGAPAGSRAALAQGCILCAEGLLADGQVAAAVRLYDTVRAADVPKPRRLEATRGAILARKAGGLQLLLETVRSPDKATFNLGLRTARELPGRVVTQALAAELESTDPGRQAPLLLALADRNDDAALPAVFQAARNGSKPLRLVAIGVLEKLENPPGVAVLLETLADRDTEVVNAAKTALLRLPAQLVDDQLVANLGQVNGGRRRALLELAGQRHVAAAVPQLLSAANDADPGVRAVAVIALGQMAGAGGWPAASDLLAQAKTALLRAASDSAPAIRAAGIDALGQIADSADLGTLIDLLAKSSSTDAAAVEVALASVCRRSPDKTACAHSLLGGFADSRPATKCSLLRVLGTAGTASALDAVRSHLASQDATVRDTAVRVLADWPDASALSGLLEVFRTTSNPTHRFLALRGCVRLLEPGSQPVQGMIRTYRELLAGAKDTDDRKVILSGLGNIPDPEALKLAAPLLEDAAVRAEAELAMLDVAAGIVGSAPNDAKAVLARLQTESSNPAVRARAGKLLNQIDRIEDFITAWQMSGPYTQAAAGGSLFDTAFSPETSDGKTSWRVLPAGTQAARPWMLDLLAALGGENRVGYARTWVYSEKPQAVRVEYGTDDGHKLWVNGKLIHQANRGGAAVPGDFKVEVQLRQGWNTVLLKVTQDTGPWEFCLRFRTPTGDRLEGLRVQSFPPDG
ncbi:MAG: HEAT repeat domain-containing protein [Verrucomicrobia bacterium]|nr:HEAT repeat domain-containing protein [Verrucomicrobiota bacterium]